MFLDAVASDGSKPVQMKRHKSSRLWICYVDLEESLGFESSGVESQTEGGIKVATNHEAIELPDESDLEDDERVEIAQNVVHSTIFGGLV
ncbi:hypothetical protein LOK49_LG09G00607 [Camellia lanceoleosa]|uniref:Uncharacterized protein n=1 Tax=Camellia lanceoleosa TaxID=1840588 RepID=A0ACC0GI55_9ERIC|nr:hypothetical protein LOK49_LG09G00607 [Camellia lanceoleosa]